MTKAPDLSDFTKDEIKDELKKIRHPFDIAVFGLDNYFNAGSIIRTAHSYLADRIHLIECTKYYRKACMGAAKYETIEKYDSMIDFIELNIDSHPNAGIEGRNLIAIECSHDYPTVDIKDFEYPEYPILLFGSEKFGIPDLALRYAKSIVSIQQFGLTNSMNVSVAAGIVMQDWITKNFKKVYE